VKKPAAAAPAAEKKVEKAEPVKKEPIKAAAKAESAGEEEISQ
jgi:hypothetical protein